MPVNGYSVGRDVRLDINTPNGPAIFSKITGFTAKQETVDIKVRPLNEPPQHLYLPDGWGGSFDFERRTSQLDAYFAASEATYWQGGDPGVITITETITEPDGSITQWQYINVVLKYEDSGMWKADDSVKQKVSFWASQRLPLQ